MTTVAPDPVSRLRAVFDATPHAAGRAAAFGRFAELGFPSQREEAWKYTSLRRLETRTFPPATREQSLAAESPAVPELGAHRALLVNGFLDWSRSSLAALPDGLRVRSYATARGNGAGEPGWSHVPAGGGTERFAALNAALFDDAVLIEVAPSLRPDSALHLVLQAAGDAPSMSQPRVIVRLAADAALTLVLHHVGDDRAERFVNTVVDLDAGERSELTLNRLQQHGQKTFHIERIEATVARSARLTIRDASFGGSLARTDVHVRLAGESAATEITGLFLADRAHHIDTQIVVDHLATGTTSLQDYRGIAGDRGRGVIDSKVIVHDGAQKSVARQTTRNLLLTPGAEIDAKPELEIRADDVQCSHGATTGQLDPAALFYLRTRGLTEADARNVLTRAFAGPVLSRIEHAQFARLVRDEFEARLDRQIAVTP